MGYSLIPSTEVVLEYFNRLSPQVKSKTPQAPDSVVASAALIPNNKSAAPGPITKVNADGDIRKLSVQASLYHGMSGGPVIIIDPTHGVVGVSGLCIYCRVIVCVLIALVQLPVL
jgi:N-acetylmuramoyl-L-alanine amidase